MVALTQIVVVVALTFSLSLSWLFNQWWWWVWLFERWWWWVWLFDQWWWQLGFFEFAIFCFGCFCCIFGLIWYFVALVFDDFAGVWEHGGFEIYDFVFNLIFGFFCVFVYQENFLVNWFVCRGRTWSSCFGKEEMNVLAEKKKRKVKKKN